MPLQFPGFKSNCLTLSYDDGVRQDARMIELMKQYGIAGTFNINSGLMAPEGTTYPESQIFGRMTESQCKALYSDEPLVEVATHGVWHRSPDTLSSVQMVNEIMDDRKKLEGMFGGICRGHAYANGRFSTDTLRILETCGIAYARTTKSTYKFKLPDNWLQLNPTCHHADPRLMELADQFLDMNSGAVLGLFYLWGHTYEFDEHKNWDVIEEFFKKVSHNDNIWYATNIQVYDYLTAAKQAQFSADERTVYNPTRITLYFKNFEKFVTVPGGETVSLF